MSKNGGVLNNLIWKFAERISAQLVTLVVSIILARLLSPADYGTIAIVNIFITLANVFVSDGFGSALIQKKDADALDFSSVLYFNLALSTVLYLALFFAAPFIAAFYGEGYEILTPVLRVLGLRIILSAVNSVQQAYVSKKMIFQKFFWATLYGTVISAVVGIAMAYAGFGVWALVVQYLVNTSVGTLFLAITLKKKPLFAFSIARLKGLIGYGASILATNLLITGYQELRALIIGKLYSSADLAYYDKGKQFPMLLVTNINTSIGAVLFPKMAEEQDDIKRLKQTTRNSIKISSYIMTPLMLGMAGVAENFVSLVLTDKWLPCVPLLKLFCVVYLFQPIHTANMQAIKALGRSDILFKLETTKKVIELVFLLAVMWISVEAIVVIMAVQTVIFTFVNAYPNKKLLDYGIKEQFKDIFGSVLMSVIMFIVVLIIGKLNIPILPLLCLQVLVGGIIYILLSVIMHNSEFEYVVNLVKSKLTRK